MSRPVQKSTQSGFTLIELLVTTAITAMILLTASSILMTFFVSNTRTTLRRQIKSEGNRALSRVEFIARGAQSCVDTNTLNTQFPSINDSNVDIVFTYIDGTRYRFYADGSRNLIMETMENDYTLIGSAEGLLTNFVLANTANFRLQCVTEAGTTKQYSNIRFDVTTAETSTVSEIFTTLVSLRNSR